MCPYFFFLPAKLLDVRKKSGLKAKDEENNIDQPVKLMAKKNAEIAYFKAELDTLLAELASTQAQQKNNKSIYN